MTQQTCLLKAQQTVCEYIHACERGAKTEGSRLLVRVVNVDPAVTLDSPLSHACATLGLTVGQPWVNLGHPRGNGGSIHQIYCYLVLMIGEYSCHLSHYYLVNRRRYHWALKGSSAAVPRLMMMPYGMLCIVVVCCDNLSRVSSTCIVSTSS